MKRLYRCSDFAIKENTVPSRHPWEPTIKLEYTNRIKTAHNSIHNPQYPIKVEKKKLKKDRVQFTIIGNRTTKEFIYAVKLTQALHKYRWQHFDAPIIRGVTSVEWPQVWNDLKIEHGGYAFCLKTQVAVLINNKFLGGDEDLKKLIEAKYIYHMCLDYRRETVEQFASFIKYAGRPCAYMHISINKDHVGTLIFMLYADLVPYTCENFLRLCKEKRGGYTGTPVHRIVKEGWIQCGGFGIKSTDLECENFIVPHDRRGVLCMANDGRSVDCSTQFFVLLQPAPWMAHRYVAFGQLIDGESTLKAIENVPTWYEAPTSEIIIFKSGILNLDCQEIVISKETREYIQAHIEDLFSLQKWLIQILLERLFLEIEMREISKLTHTMLGEFEEEEQTREQNIHATQRFMRNKSDIEKQIATSNFEFAEKENDEFDVEMYQYEPEEYLYEQATPKQVSSEKVQPEKPYYLALTDVLYPGEVDSIFDLRRFLRGDYCLESDLENNVVRKRPVMQGKLSFSSEFFMLLDDLDTDLSEASLDSDDEKEIKKYLKLHSDRVSFAGGIIRGIARGPGQHNLLQGNGKSELITDETLRRFRLQLWTLSGTAKKKRGGSLATDLPDASTVCNKVHSFENRKSDVHAKKVSIQSERSDKQTSKMLRRPTGFTRAFHEDLFTKKSKRDSQKSEEDVNLRKVRIVDSTADGPGERPSRRQTGYVHPYVEDADQTEPRRSALTRLYDNVDDRIDEFRPTLKTYKPLSEVPRNNLLLTLSPPNSRIRSDDDSAKERYIRRSTFERQASFEELLNIQHAKKLARKVSSDYVKTINNAEQKPHKSIRSVEFARTRPSLSVYEYQNKNKKREPLDNESYLKGQRRSKMNKTIITKNSFILEKYIFNACNKTKNV